MKARDPWTKGPMKDTYRVFKCSKCGYTYHSPGPVSAVSHKCNNQYVNLTPIEESE